MSTTYSDKIAMNTVIITSQANPLQNPITASSEAFSQSSSSSYNELMQLIITNKNIYIINISFTISKLKKNIHLVLQIIVGESIVGRKGMQNMQSPSQC